MGRPKSVILDTNQAAAPVSQPVVDQPKGKEKEEKFTVSYRVVPHGEAQPAAKRKTGAAVLDAAKKIKDKAAEKKQKQKEALAAKKVAIKSRISSLKLSSNSYKRESKELIKSRSKWEKLLAASGKRLDALTDKRVNTDKTINGLELDLKAISAL